MSDYNYETENNRLDIKPSVGSAHFFMFVHEGRDECAIHIPNGDAPRVALELLKAAGYGTGKGRGIERISMRRLEDFVTHLESKATA